ncbi:ABC transporter permease [Halalkalibacter urbisdiaboli]|uniref:ABC transporter permease n=1 Tax=Halalkalibacter urbisdiaboli TaxID=1960589 RepID=UPI000B44CCA1|nr:FtsX-like permease family protein [Halalkalibacter urbisdiaboli]
MLLKIVKKDFLKNRIITIGLFIFIFLSALLIVSGATIMTELSNSIHGLFAKSNAPHFVQMHAGDLDQDSIDEFALSHNLVKDQQTVEMVNIHGTNIEVEDGPLTDRNTVMDHYFVKQNRSFDFLLNLESEVIDVSQGEIAVPIYYMQQKNIQLGDNLTVSHQGIEKEFTVVEFVRDVMMNPSIIHSKRFVVNEDDFDMLKTSFGDVEYMIEFQLTDLSKLKELRNAYQSADLPMQGPSIDYQLFQMLHAITDGIVAAVIMLVSLLLMMIALLCLRFTIIAAIEEDYKEIGVLKAIGIRQGDLKKLYQFKYIFLAAMACISGYIASLPLSQMFTANMMLYIGTAPKSSLLHMIPLLAMIFIFFIFVLSCHFILRRFNHISAVEALRSESVRETNKFGSMLKLHKSRGMNVNTFLVFKDVLGRLKMYSLILFVFFICSFIIIITVNFLNTIQSSHFITYMGIERSDIRIDVQHTENAVEKFNDVITYIRNDTDVERFSPIITSQQQVVNSDGVHENIMVETGNFSIFPLAYLEGDAPTNEHEIALSYLNAQELESRVGAPIRLIIDGQDRRMIVSGIYQDVTNGGRTAKALFPINPETALWYEVSLNVKPHISIRDKIDEYARSFQSAKVTDMEGYLTQTLGNTIEQLSIITMITVLISLFVAMLITSFFMKMLVAKDYDQMAVMKSIGFSTKHLQIQYVSKLLIILGVAIITGTIFSNTIGQSLVSALFSFMGASNVKFVIDPVQAYIVYPLMLMSAVAITTLLSITSIKQIRISDIN